MGGRREEYVLEGVLCMYIDTCSGSEGWDGMHAWWAFSPCTEYCMYVRYLSRPFHAVQPCCIYCTYIPPPPTPSGASPPTNHHPRSTSSMYLPTYLTSLLSTSTSTPITHPPRSLTSNLCTSIHIYIPDAYTTYLPKYTSYCT